MTSPLKTAALEALERGWSIFPVQATGEYAKRPHYCLTDTGHTKVEDGRTKPSWKPLQDVRATPEQVSTWYAKEAGKGLAVITGQISSLVILDFDGVAGEQTRQNLGLPAHVRTGSGGAHAYFEHPGWKVSTLNSKSKLEMGQLWPGLDIRADGGYAVMPPSRNASGPYRWEATPGEVLPLTVLPDELRAYLGLLDPPSVSQPVQRSAEPLQAYQGQRRDEQDRPSVELLLSRALDRVANEGRNNAGMWLACQLRDNNYSEGEAVLIAGDYAARTPPYDAHGQLSTYAASEARSTVRSAYSQPARESWQKTPASQAGAAASNLDGLALRPSSVSAGSDVGQIHHSQDVGPVFVCPPDLKSNLTSALAAQRADMTLRTADELTAEYLQKLRQEERNLYAMRPSPSLARLLDRSGTDWHAVGIPVLGSPAETVASLEDLATAAHSTHLEGDQGFLLEEFPDFLDARALQPGALYPSSFAPLDAALGGGYYPGLHVLGGVTAGGKTALALHIAESNARAGRPVLFITFEQSRAELWTRIVSPRVGISLGAFRSGGSADFPLGTQLKTNDRYLDVAHNVAPHLRVFEGDGASGAQQWGVDRLVAEVRRLRRLYGQAPLVILDYLQRMPAEKDTDKRHQVDEVVMNLQVRLGRQEQTPILLLSSVSRGNYGELLQRPLDERLSVFKESGGIEYTAYSATLVYPLSVVNASELGMDLPPMPGSPQASLKGLWRYVVLDLVKNREGEAGMQLAVKWWPASSRYEIVGPIDASDLPPEKFSGGRKSGR